MPFCYYRGNIITDRKSNFVFRKTSGFWPPTKKIGTLIEANQLVIDVELV